MTGIDRKALKELKSFPDPVRNYLLGRLNWREYFSFNYSASSIYPNTSHVSPGIDRKALQAIAGILDAKVRQYFLSRLGWNNYYIANY